jgi:hypothetical protein
MSVFLAHRWRNQWSAERVVASAASSDAGVRFLKKRASCRGTI